jgi:hypothetical protein
MSEDKMTVDELSIQLQSLWKNWSNLFEREREREREKERERERERERIEIARLRKEQ